MINEEKVALMTHLAISERREGKQNASIRTYFRGDYIGLNILKAIICASLCYALVGAVYVVYNLTTIMDSLYEMDYMEMAGNIVKSYLLVVGIYVAISYFVALVRYHLSRRNQKKYFSLLKRLADLYKEEKGSK